MPKYLKLHKILCPDLYPVFPKCGNAPNIQNSYSSTLWWHLGLHNTSLDAKFRVQNFSFLLINLWLKVPGSTISLNLYKYPQYTKKIYNLTHSLPLGLSSTLFNARFRLENLKLFTMYYNPWFKRLHPLFPIPSMHQIYYQCNSNSTN